MFDDRAELIEALEQERERSDALAAELADVLDTLRAVTLGMDALGVLAMKSAGARTDGVVEWRVSIANKRAALTGAISELLSWHDEPTPKPKRKRKPA